MGGIYPTISVYMFITFLEFISDRFPSASNDGDLNPC